MIGFSYTYKTSGEILESVSHLSSMWFIDLILIIISLLLVSIFVFLVIPSSIILHEYSKEKKSKRTKKNLLTQILLQKEIEDEVEKEVEIESESSLT